MNLIAEEILNILPANIKNIVLNAKGDGYLQEIRIKSDKPLILIFDREEYITDYIVTSIDIRNIMSKMMNYSLYAYDQEIRQGYITIKGGHRVGICGSCVLEGEKIKTINNISSLNIRVSKQVIGCSDKLIPYLMINGEIENTIIISPPKCGKTTMIRDMARNFSKNFKVCIIDERSEIGGLSLGKSSLDLGIRTDILDNCPKAQGIMMAIRSMSPDIIICDEIGTFKDMESILTAICCGIKIITTIHGKDENDLFERPVFKEILINNAFKKGIILKGNEVGQVSYIYDFHSKKRTWEG
ncbi:MAG: stage III sporulation protein AA [Bacillota bacterium]|nr:stage III sporulation protein AA [Bacillota bacterium]